MGASPVGKITRLFLNGARCKEFFHQIELKQSKGFVRNASKLQTLRFKVRICLGQAEQAESRTFVLSIEFEIAVCEG